MCRKITSTDALYPNLVAYYNFDESTGATAFDGTINNNNGILINSPARVTSGAAIGNASSHDYVNAIKTTTLSHTTGESLTVTSTAGSPDGIQVYRVDGQPNTLSGATGVGSNDKYFGVFQAGGTAPQYTAVYNYSGNLGVNIGNEFQLRLNKRTDNAATTWSILPDVANEAANTITVTGQSTEYILGKVGVPLPVSILSFTGTLKNQTVLLQWKVTEEINTVQFVIERSNGSNAFTTIGTKQPLNAGNTGYTLTDNAPFANGAVQYYRLKIIDKNGGYKYSNIIRISSQSTNQPVIIFPNPVKDVITISGLKQTGTIKIISADGKMMQQQIVTAQTITLDLSNYAKGIYLLQYLVKGEVLSQKIIKQ
jgi:Secretion system C-terminal sorting domain